MDKMTNDAPEKLEEMSSWLRQGEEGKDDDDDHDVDERFFFELQTQRDQPGLENVELIATKTYVKGMILLVLYFEGSWYVRV